MVWSFSHPCGAHLLSAHAYYHFNYSKRNDWAHACSCILNRQFWRALTLNCKYCGGCNSLSVGLDDSTLTKKKKKRWNKHWRTCMPTWPRSYPEFISGLACTSCSKIAFVRSAKRVTRQMGKRSKDLDTELCWKYRPRAGPKRLFYIGKFKTKLPHFLVLSESVQSKDSVFVL